MKNDKTMTGVYTSNNEDFIFNFKTTFTTSDKLNFVNSVVDTVVDDAYYNSIIRDIIFDFMLVKMMTDIETENFNLDDIENFLSSTNVVDIIKVNMEDGLIDELNKAVNLGIEYKTGIHVNPVSEALSSLLSTIEKEVSEIDLSNLDNMMEIASNLTKMSGEFTVENVVNAYMNSDVHKKNLNEIDEFKTARLEIVNQED